MYVKKYDISYHRRKINNSLKTRDVFQPLQRIFTFGWLTRNHEPATRGIFAICGNHQVLLYPDVYILYGTLPKEAGRTEDEKWWWKVDFGEEQEEMVLEKS